MFPAATVNLLITYCCLFTNTVFRHPFLYPPPHSFFFLKGVFATCSPVLMQPSCEQRCQLGWATKETPRICRTWKESKRTVNLLETTGGFDRLSGVCAGNITAPEPRRRLQPTGLYSHAGDSWAETHLRASGSSGEKVTKPRWLTGERSLQSRAVLAACWHT